ncbi:sigma-70 family RNA polymerase sigma factor [Pseudoxanthomonas putridarboris]|uniref:sigma-70 family RNA polymerase sigma factor n=1 Tax=Pseudoxanthomonas putridarboris TaxID=752605 RepID=UPI00311FB101
MSYYTEVVPDDIENVAREYHAELLRMLRARLPNAQDAQDLAQEAYARVMRYQGQLKGEELRLMLFRIAQNLITDHYRWNRLRENAHFPIEDMKFELSSEEPTHDRRLDNTQRLKRLEKIVLAMPERRRAVFLLSRIEGLTNVEIARRRGITVKAVEKHIAKAIAECRNLAEDDGS